MLPAVRDYSGIWKLVEQYLWSSFNYILHHIWKKKKETLTELLLIENSHTILLELLWAMVLLCPFLACDLGLLNQNVNTFNMSIFIVLE